MKDKYYVLLLVAEGDILEGLMYENYQQVKFLERKQKSILRLEPDFDCFIIRIALEEGEFWRLNTDSLA